MLLETFLTRLGIALLAGLLIGLEREIKHKDAGLRTHLLVTMGAALYTLIAANLLATGDGDPTRVIGQIVVGIGFLGAGVIIQEGGSVKGLTTAATIWCSAAVGCLAAIGKTEETLVVAGCIIIINALLHFLEEKLAKQPPHH